MLCRLCKGEGKRRKVRKERVSERKGWEVWEGVGIGDKGW